MCVVGLARPARLTLPTMLSVAPIVLSCFRPASDMGAEWCFQVSPGHNCSGIYQTTLRSTLHPDSQMFQLCKYDQKTGDAAHSIVA